MKKSHFILVMRSKQVTNFLEQSRNTLKKQELVYLNFGNDAELSSHALQDIQSIKALSIRNIILFVDLGNMELIMDIVRISFNNRRRCSVFQYAFRVWYKLKNTQ